MPFHFEDEFTRLIAHPRFFVYFFYLFGKHVPVDNVLFICGTVAPRSQGPILRPTSEIRPTRASGVHLISQNKRKLDIKELSD
jgi:hypothetical protein